MSEQFIYHIISDITSIPNINSIKRKLNTLAKSNGYLSFFEYNLDAADNPIDDIEDIITKRVYHPISEKIKKWFISKNALNEISGYAVDYVLGLSDGYTRIYDIVNTYIDEVQPKAFESISDIERFNTINSIRTSDFKRALDTENSQVIKSIINKYKDEFKTSRENINSFSTYLKLKLPPHLYVLAKSKGFINESELNEVDYDFLARSNRDADKNIRYAGGFNKPVPQQSSNKPVLTMDRYDMKERSAIIYNIAKQQQILAALGYNLDTVVENPLKAPTTNEAKKIIKQYNDLKDKLKKHKYKMSELSKEQRKHMNTLKSKAKEAEENIGKFPILKKGYDKYTKNLNKVILQHKKGSILD